MTMLHRYVVFTDLDGTLLDHDTYSFDKALPALRMLEREGIPLVINSSKTRPEIERYRSLLGNNHPFVTENGGGIYIPDGYFGRDFHSDRAAGGYSVVGIGTSRGVLRDVLKSVARETGIRIKGVSDMALPEIEELTGLGPESAEFVRERDYSEPFIVFGDDVEVGRKIIEKGFGYTRGSRFHHILGGNDKGKAVRFLTDLYRSESPSVETLGIGDNLNDLAMLEEVDFPMLVRKKGGAYEERCRLPGVILADGEGPSGFNSAILKFFINNE
ncbi:MAG TPA: HAD-IIB family hydrolase [Thermodesulfobacteriota bacterium]|nr:HAD-IIB family hydrolase [Thermodesulfobacteriota bacterium]